MKTLMTTAIITIFGLTSASSFACSAHQHAKKVTKTTTVKTTAVKAK